MKNPLKLFIVIFTLLPFFSNAQLFDKIVNRTIDKTADRISDKIVERTSDEISQAAHKKVDNALDTIFEKNYRAARTASGNEGGDFEDLMKDFDRSADVPDYYEFDVLVEIETTDHKDRIHKTTMMVQEAGEFFGYMMDENVIVMDAQNGLMVTYNEEEKTAMAMPNLMGLASGYVNHEVNELMEDYTFEKTGRIKSILGYHCEEYVGSYDDVEFESWIAIDFPISMQESLSGFLGNMGYDSFDNFNNTVDGMILESVSREGKKEYTYKTISVQRKLMKIENSGYNFGMN